ncbi:MAG TPA: CheR family methyltransferase [Burkholderiales bacterium]|nr:CheR family methyltransferase [Burkholderiales bacterium]
MNEAASDSGLEELLQQLRRTRGFDFTGYKRPSLARRIERRMQATGAADYAAYAAYLQQNDQEYALLFNTILINVTSFFRDPPAWDLVRDRVIPDILGAKGEHDPVRLWSAGCASGEEAYSLAILLLEAMGEEGFTRRVKIYATDVDEEALREARLGAFTARDMAAVPAELRERYFRPAGARHVFRPELRRALIFGRHDLGRDAPIPRIDLLACRNTIMYFNAETQARVLEKFRFALGEHGPSFLFLGRAEMLLTHSSLFEPVDLKCRVFRKVPQPGARRRPAPALQAQPAPTPDYNGEGMATRLHDRSAEEMPLARIVVDANGVLTLANQRARALFSLSPNDVGRPLQDLEVSYRPVELRSLIEEAYAAKRVVTRERAEQRFAEGESHFFDVAVAPFFDDRDQSLGASITYIDVTQIGRLQSDLVRAREEIQTATEELQSSNEELETTNEELQSSNEELETTNEELQSTNEELETMNEELQSTNEELQAVNEQLRKRTDELNRSNGFLESVLRSLRSGAVVVNANFDILMWNQRAADLWGLRAEEVVGRSFLNLDIGLPVAEVRRVVRPCLSGDEEQSEAILEAINRRGKTIQCRVSCAPLVDGEGKRAGVIILMDEAR